MIVEINAPSRRSLNANEKRVYQLAREGKALNEIGEIMGLPVHYEGMAAEEPLNVKSIIAQIKAKGWEINEEDNNVARGNKTPQDIRDKIVLLHSEGKRLTEIVNAVKLPPTTVRNIIQQEEDKRKAPASAATDTSAKGIITETAEPNSENVSAVADIIPEKSEKVKHVYSEDAINAVYNQMLAKAKEIAQLRFRLDRQIEMEKLIQRGVDTLDRKIQYAQAEFERLEQDYDNMCGGAR